MLYGYVKSHQVQIELFNIPVTDKIKQLFCLFIRNYI